MRRRIAQSQLVQAPTTFRPTSAWSRISFLDLLSPDGDPRAPLLRLEPAYDERCATLIAVWPQGDLEAVGVALWSPPPDAIVRLAAMQVDWPPALCDLRVRTDPHGRIQLVPCRTSIARLAVDTDTEEALRILHALERGARAIGRATTIAA